MRDIYFTNEKNQRCIKRGSTLFIERTKDFYIKEGREKEDSFIKAIRLRGGIGTLQ